MVFNINTKYNIGDIVYIANHYYDMYAEREPYVVKDVLIYANDRRTYISYEVEQDGFFTRIPEEWLFRTFEECAEWCKEENG